MSTTSQLTDFSDLYTDLQNRVRVATSVTATENQAKRYINIALQDMHVGNGEVFWWAQREEILRTKAPYSTGTVVATKGSTTITGTSTLWNTSDDFGVANVVVGGKITFAGSTDIYEIATVASDTSATLTTAFISTTLSAADYEYFEEDYALDDDFLRPVDLTMFSDKLEIDLIGAPQFRKTYPRRNITGRPRIATLIARDPSGDANVIRRVRFWKPPDDEYLIPYGFVTNKLATSSSGTRAANLSADTDEPIVPLAYRHTIVFHALYHWYRDKKDDQRSQEAKLEYQDMILRIQRDTEIGAPRPRIQPRVSSYKRRAQRPWSGARTTKHVTGPAFDELRQ